MQSGTTQFVRFSSPAFVVLAGVGASLGFSNVLNFPALVAKYGGGSFLLVYLASKLLVAVPVVMAEMAMGRRTRQSPFSGMEVLSLDSHANFKWRYLGMMGMIAGLLILAVYAVVFTWSASYFSHFVFVEWHSPESSFVGYFVELISHTGHLALYLLGFMFLLFTISSLGLKWGLQIALIVIVPLMAVCVLLLAGNAAASPSFVEAFSLVFGFQWDKLSWLALLDALQHSFFTLGVGMGAVWAYSSYMPKSMSIGKTGVAIAGLDFLIALFFALFVWSQVLSQDQTLANGAGVLFQQLPELISRETAVVFFFLMVLTGISSSIFLFEPSVQWLDEHFLLGRVKASALLAVVVFVVAFFALSSFNFLSWLHWYGRTIFDNLVYISSGILVPLCGFLTAVFVGWVMHPSEVVEEIRPSHPVRYTFWRFAIKFISILAIAMVFFAALEQYLGISISASIVLLLALLVLLVGGFKLYKDALPRLW